MAELVGLVGWVLQSRTHPVLCHTGLDLLGSSVGLP